jgi:hypothetical protein
MRKDEIEHAEKTAYVQLLMMIQDVDGKT